MNNENLESNPTQILVVDDSALIRSVIQETLLEAGYQVLLAADGLEAWEKLQKEPIQLAVVDLSMPRMDGMELTRMIRSDERLRTLPIILISAADSNEDWRRGLEYGANAFISKDRHDLDALPARIVKLLKT